MDRLARNLDDLRRLVRTLTGKGVRVEFIKESLTFTGEDSPMAAEPGITLITSRNSTPHRT
jgi:DNA invertase Pin-like site-specific DNA recombinase